MLLYYKLLKSAILNTYQKLTKSRILDFRFLKSVTKAQPQNSKPWSNYKETNI